MQEKYLVGARMPKSIGLCADLFAEVRELRLAMQKHVDEVHEREKEIREYIIDNLSKSDDSGAAGKRYRAQIVQKVVPAIRDWNKIVDFMITMKRFDLVQKRLADRAVKDLWEEGIQVPGVERFKATDVSIRKI